MGNEEIERLAEYDHVRGDLRPQSPNKTSFGRDSRLTADDDGERR